MEILDYHGVFCVNMFLLLLLFAPLVGGVDRMCGRPGLVCTCSQLVASEIVDCASRDLLTVPILRHASPDTDSSLLLSGNSISKLTARDIALMQSFAFVDIRGNLPSICDSAIHAVPGIVTDCDTTSDADTHIKDTTDGPHTPDIRTTVPQPGYQPLYPQWINFIIWLSGGVFSFGLTLRLCVKYRHLKAELKLEVKGRKDTTNALTAEVTHREQLEADLAKERAERLKRAQSQSRALWHSSRRPQVCHKMSKLFFIKFVSISFF